MYMYIDTLKYMCMRATQLDQSTNVLHIRLRRENGGFIDQSIFCLNNIPLTTTRGYSSRSSGQLSCLKGAGENTGTNAKAC